MVFLYKHLEWRTERDSQLLGIPKKEWKWESLSKGEQGVVGIVSHGCKRLLYKISHSIDNTMAHEYHVMRILNELSEYCIHFNRCVSLERHPHKVSSGVSIPLDMLLTEYIPSVCSFRDLLEYGEKREIMSLTRQVFMAVWFSQSFGYTHYDLHANNILVQKCLPNVVLEYHIENQKFLVPTYGYIASIIDHGYAYVDTPKEEGPAPFLASMWFMDKGYLGVVHDPRADFCKLLVSLQNEYTRNPRLSSAIAKLFKRVIFEKDTGWDRSNIPSAPDVLYTRIKRLVKGSKLLYGFDTWLDGLQLLIHLPLTRTEYDLECFKEFSREWVKVEERISKQEILLSLFFTFCKVVARHRLDVLHPLKRSETIAKIKITFVEEFDKVVKFHLPLLDYESMVCSAILMAQAVEGIYYDTLQKKLTEKQHQYRHLVPKTPRDFWDFLQIHVPQDEFPEEQKIILMNSDLRILQA